MKDFTEPSEILSYLTEINVAACDAIAANDFNAFQNVVDELHSAEINRTPLGRSVIAYNNMFNTVAPFFTLDNHYAYEKFKDNFLMLTDENFRKTVSRIERIKEENLYHLIGFKSFSFTEDSIKKDFSESHEYAGYDADFGEIDAKSKEIKDDTHAEHIIVKKIVKAEMKYIQDIRDTFEKNPSGLYFPEKKQKPESTEKEKTQTSFEIHYSSGFTNQWNYESNAKDYFEPIVKLTSARYKFIFNYQTEIDLLKINNESLTLSQKLDEIQKYIDGQEIQYQKPLFTIAGTSFDKGSYKKRFTLAQYLASTAAYPEKRLRPWKSGHHYEETYKKYKRETALRTFLYLGIPAEYLDTFFKWYGIAFGYSTDAFEIDFCEHKDKHIMTESYIHDLICCGLAYDVINYILPKRPPKKFSKSKTPASK